MPSWNPDPFRYLRERVSRTVGGIIVIPPDPGGGVPTPPEGYALVVENGVYVREGENYVAELIA
jgi:hypothetical protein